LGGNLVALKINGVYAAAYVNRDGLITKPNTNNNYANIVLWLSSNCMGTAYAISDSSIEIPFAGIIGHFAGSSALQLFYADPALVSQTGAFLSYSTDGSGCQTFGAGPWDPPNTKRIPLSQGSLDALGFKTPFAIK
jgi:hypothetical protein